MLDALYLLATLENARPHFAVPAQPEIVLAAAYGRLAPWRRGVRFDIDQEPTDPLPENPSADAGASLPISGFVVTDLPGTERYMSASGSGSTCLVGSPCGTFSAAQTSASTGDTIVARGGTYRGIGSICTSGCTTTSPSYTAQTTITKAITISAYPGETPIFRGSTDVTASFAAGTTENGAGASGANLKYIAYTPVPVTDGSGANFASSGQNVVGGLAGTGIYPDQVWVGDATSGPYQAWLGKLQQVTAKNQVADGKFYVDRTNGRLYITTADAAQSAIEACSRGNFLSISNQVTIQGIRVERYCNTASRFGVLILNASADGTQLKNVEINDSSLVTASLAGGATDLLQNVLVEDVTVTGPDWMGFNPVYTDGLIFRRFKATLADMRDEYLASPQSGQIKTSRTHCTTVEFSFVADNRSNGIWMDQSNFCSTGTGYTVVCSNTFVNNGTVAGDNSFFFEISDKLLFCNNYAQAPTKNPLKMSGSSGLVLWNNTLIGGSDALGFYADGRSNTSLHCADPAFPICANSFDSDRWKSALIARPATLDWMPRLDLLKNNIIANPTATGLCNVPAAFCVADTNNTTPGSQSTIQSMIHPAEPGRGIPATAIDHNLYANGAAGNIIVRKVGSTATPYTQAQIATWRSYLAGAPVSISGLDANSLTDLTGSTYVDATGAPTLALDHNLAEAVPTDTTLNAYIPAGTKHFGVTWQ